MRVLAVSDTHERHFDLKDLPKADLLIHAGDATMMGQPFAVRAFNEWLGEQNQKEKVFVAGNHDFWFESHPEYARKEMTNCHYLQDSSVVINDFLIYGTPWQPFYYNWAFQCETEAELDIKFSKIPDNTDILVCHCPPYGILDRNRKGESIGSKALRDWIFRKTPKVVVFGHCHEGYGFANIDGINFINAATCDRQYEPNNLPVLFDLSKNGEIDFIR